ncbi:hypothetical protein FOQG_06011 [Fusarium oxysporum f. sp. raphani 54005]|uniref:Uncharacterized protein n=8 Tax=Fusarium oxysporum TaxID=5507 RepID=W9IAW5_FUSOX|nr:hypothetical protein FOXG_20326 [Fusarium oxysporum f. sp. lycopersici 4287]EWY91787.1 hypothetical protein FOYG_08755 [Fusarium oxysporum NRRL 32931]EWZ38452.1 hypothetical protein FOZG_10053 [Fusarium oxysporum Fo47]EWZ83012.1 hypothetical protein FOWG_13741 [Fusarium oxysporum f. sp. lycopersici MN25]EXA46042.1 hypothetical protein FOVG_06823 [Fusarium oxysporum f. sp. pisi HDV247]EXK40544.1 hypothetical protein FOMG_07345 [Fusarium oxysporum f. sp. melonis 26406]EXK92041.1 hypothetical
MAAQGLVFDAIFGSNHLVTIPSQILPHLTGFSLQVQNA